MNSVITEVTDGKDATVPQAAKWPGWLPLAAFPLCAIALRGRFPAWAFMWAFAFAVFAGCKWLTWWQVWMRGTFRGTRPGWKRSLGYLLAWPGMDGPAFLGAGSRPAKAAAAEWALAVLKTLFGAALLWVVARTIPPERPLLAGWAGMLGLIFLLHFGSFHLLSLIWRSAGVDARPLMRAPALATSLGDFWGGRWNLGFHQLAHGLVFRPLRRRLGGRAAMLAAFLASGLVHELVISLPAGGGYGLPTAYFLLQGLGLWMERSAAARRIGLGRGPAGWAFTLLVTAGPLFWLFHPPFVTRVVLPFLRAVRAL